MRQTIPKAPHPDTLNNLSPDEAEEMFSQWERDCERVMEKNAALFEKDLKKIKLCAFLRGFSRAFSFSIHPYNVSGLEDIEHYSWCPSDQWTDNTGKYLRIEVAEKV